MNIKMKYSELMGGLGIFGSPNKSLTGEGNNRREDNRENGEESVIGEGSPRLTPRVRVMEYESIREELRAMKNAREKKDKEDEFYRREQKNINMSINKNIDKDIVFFDTGDHMCIYRVI